MSRYLTLVVRLADNADARLVFEQVERINGVALSASSWSHVMDARDTLTAELANTQAALAMHDKIERETYEKLAASEARVGVLLTLIEDMRDELYQYTEGFSLLWGRVDAALSQPKGDSNDQAK